MSAPAAKPWVTALASLATIAGSVAGAASGAIPVDQAAYGTAAALGALGLGRKLDRLYAVWAAVAAATDAYKAAQEPQRREPQ